MRARMPMRFIGKNLRPTKLEQQGQVSKCDHLSLPCVSLLRALASLDDALEVLAQNPEHAEERDQQRERQTRRSIAHNLLRDLAEGIPSRDDPAGPQAGRDAIERQKSGPRQL